MLENKETGKIIESTLSDEQDDGNSNATWNYYMKSGIVITAIVGTNSTYQVDLFNTPNTIEYKRLIMVYLQRFHILNMVSKSVLI